MESCLSESYSPCRWDDYPALADLQSSNSATCEEAWLTAYSTLWAEGIIIARNRVCGPQNEQNREDIVCVAIVDFQELVIAGKYDFCNQSGTERDGMRRMFCRIVHHKCTDFFRALYRERGQPRDPETSAIESRPFLVDEPGDDGGFASIFETEELELAREKLRTAIAELPPPLPDLFSDRLDGLTAEDIAAKRGMNRATVLSHWHRGIKQIREKLTGAK